MAAADPTSWADVADEEERLASVPADLDPLIPLPGLRSTPGQALQNALEDPLGVAPPKALEMALARARAPDATFTAGSISLSSADFNPISFLAEVHKVRARHICRLLRLMTGHKAGRFALGNGKA